MLPSAKRFNLENGLPGRIDCVRVDLFILLIYLFIYSVIVDRIQDVSEEIADCSSDLNGSMPSMAALPDPYSD
jgi:hypothetical protein